MKKALAFLILTLSPFQAALATETPSAPQTAASQQDKNKTIARRVSRRDLQSEQVEVADEIYAKDFVNHGLHRSVGLLEDQAAVRWEKTVLPNLTMTVNLITAEGDLVTVVWTARGTNTGNAGGFPATGVKIEERGITVWRIVHGKIRDEWSAFDQLRLVRQVATQLKWPLLGLLCAAAILLWLAGNLIRRVRRVR